MEEATATESPMKGNMYIAAREEELILGGCKLHVETGARISLWTRIASNAGKKDKEKGSYWPVIHVSSFIKWCTQRRDRKKWTHRNICVSIFSFLIGSNHVQAEPILRCIILVIITIMENDLRECLNILPQPSRSLHSINIMWSNEKDPKAKSPLTSSSVGSFLLMLGAAPQIIHWWNFIFFFLPRTVSIQGQPCVCVYYTL